MNNRAAIKKGLGHGVYYASADYIGLSVRFAIIITDLVVLFVIFTLTLGLSFVIWPNVDYHALIMRNQIPFILFGYGYLVLLKRTEFGTMGYHMFGARVVALNGKRPSVWEMTLRFLLLALGPLDFILDTFWLGGDENKQTLRDKFAGTYVIKHAAFPIGEGQVQLTPYDILGWGLLFREVKRT